MLAGLDHVEDVGVFGEDKPLGQLLPPRIEAGPAQICLSTRCRRTMRCVAMCTAMWQAPHGCELMCRGCGRADHRAGFERAGDDLTGVVHDVGRRIRDGRLKTLAEPEPEPDGLRWMLVVGRVLLGDGLLEQVVAVAEGAFVGADFVAVSGLASGRSGSRSPGWSSRSSVRTTMRVSTRSLAKATSISWPICWAVAKRLLRSLAIARSMICAVSSLMLRSCADPAAAR